MSNWQSKRHSLYEDSILSKLPDAKHEIPMQSQKVLKKNRSKKSRNSRKTLTYIDSGSNQISLLAAKTAKQFVNNKTKTEAIKSMRLMTNSYAKSKRTRN